MEHLSLLELNKLIAKTLAENLEPSYWVTAEISEVKVNPRGHCYLELVEKEEDTTISKARGTIWSTTFRSLIPWFERESQSTLKAGMTILFNATIQFHEIYGFSLNIRDIDPTYTLGERARKKKEIIGKLRHEGLLDLNKRTPFPPVPQKIAIISSKTAAGYGDFSDQLQNNTHGYYFEMQLFDALMQGDIAPASIIAAMEKIRDSQKKYDLLIIVRGGGASTDLDCFDNFDLCRHIAQFPLPVITGIGHDRDMTISDMVAHTDLKTPTAVAEFLISGMYSFEKALDNSFRIISEYWNNYLSTKSYELERIQNEFGRRIKEKLFGHRQALHDLQTSLKYSTSGILRDHNLQVTNLACELKKLPDITLNDSRQYLDHLSKQIELLDPEKILSRGYTITTINGFMISGSKDVKPGAIIKTHSNTFTIHSEVKQIENNK